MLTALTCSNNFPSPYSLLHSMCRRLRRWWESTGLVCSTFSLSISYWTGHWRGIVSCFSVAIISPNIARSPAGSVGAAESTGELKTGHRNRWFIFATDFQIDLGFVISAFVPMVVVLATGENHLRAAWRICLALGAIPPLSLLYLRYAPHGSCGVNYHL